MPRKRSLLRRQLDDSSSDDDDFEILAAAVTMDTFANAEKKNTVALSQFTEFFTVIEKAAT